MKTLWIVALIALLFAPAMAQKRPCFCADKNPPQETPVKPRRVQVVPTYIVEVRSSVAELQVTGSYWSPKYRLAEIDLPHVRVPFALVVDANGRLKLKISGNGEFAGSIRFNHRSISRTLWTFQGTGTQPVPIDIEPWRKHGRFLRRVR